MMETIKEKEKEIKQGKPGIKEWTEEDDDNMGNICNPYYELVKILRTRNLERGVVS